MADFDNGCRGKAWAGGAVTGLVVMLFLLSVGHQSFFAALFLGLLVFALFGGFLVWAFCMGSDIALGGTKADPIFVTPAEPELMAAPIAHLAEPVTASVAAAAEAAPEPVKSAPVPVMAAPAPEPETKAKAASAPKPAAKAKPEPKPKAATKAAKAKAEAKPAKAKAPKPADGKPAGLKAPHKGKADDLKLIEGIGPKLEERLNEWGIFHFDQIAGWGADEIAYADANVPRFKGRCTRDKWVEQAKIIVTEGIDAFLERAKTNDY